jgi:hypothetical protein
VYGPEKFLKLDKSALLRAAKYDKEICILLLAGACLLVGDETAARAENLNLG